MQELYIEDFDHNVFTNEDVRTCHYIYAHGKLDRIAGYDIITYKMADGFDFKTDRIEDVIAVTPDGKNTKAKLFFWHSNPGVVMNDAYYAYLIERDPVLWCHGLVVASDDIESLQYAQIQFDRKSGWI